MRHLHALRQPGSVAAPRSAQRSVVEERPVLQATLADGADRRCGNRNVGYGDTRRGPAPARGAQTVDNSSENTLEILSQGRQAGKTTKCVEWLLEDPENRTIVCAVQPHKRSIVAMLCRRSDRPADYWNVHVVTATELRNPNRRPSSLHLREVAVDDIDLVLSTLGDMPRPIFGTLAGRVAS